MSGKGSSPKPFSVSQQEYDTRWDAIFCRDLKDEEDQKEINVDNNNIKEIES